MRTQVFAYKGYIGIESDVNCEGILNKPEQPGQLGFVVDAAFVDISPEALELLKKVKKSHDDIGDVDIFQAGDKVIFSWLGGICKAIDPSKHEGSSTYSPDLIKETTATVPPKEFMDFVDGILLSK